MRQILHLVQLVALWGLSGAVHAANFYASPGAGDAGDGSIAAPWNIATALGDNTRASSANAAVRPGDTIWLMEGRYGTGGSWVVRSALKGLESAPVTVRRLPGSRAIIDGGISAQGEWTVFWCFEITNSSTNRYCTTEGRQPGLNMLGRGHKAVNLLVHDTGHPGIGFWDAVGDGGEIYGCIIWGVGIYSEDPGWNGRPRGSGIYAQNRYGDRRIVDCVAVRNFQGGFKVYSENGYCNGFHLEGNVAIANGYQGYHVESLRNPITSLTLENNIAVNDRTVTLGIASVTNQTLIFRDNHVVDELYGGYQTLLFAGVWQNLSISGNHLAFVGTNLVWKDSAQYWSIVRGNGPQVVDENQYFGGDKSLCNFRLHPFGKITLDAMRANTGWESSGTVSSDRAPSNTVVHLRPNRHEAGRGHLSVINWAGLSSLPVDLTPLQLRDGQEFEIRDAQNPLGPPLLRSRFRPGQPWVEVPLDNRSVAELIGAHPHFTPGMERHTGLLFNVLLVLPVDDAVGIVRPHAPLDLRVKSVTNG